MKRHVGASVWLALGGVLLFWPSAFAGIRVGLRGYTPEHLVLGRFVIASVALAVFAVATRMPLPDRRDLPALVVLGLTGFTLYQVLLARGEVTVNSGTASFLIATAPIFTAVFAVAFYGERLSPWGWVSVAIGFSGGVLIAFGSGRRIQLSAGSTMLLGASVATAAFNVLQKPLLEKYTALQVITLAMWISTASMTIFAPGLVSAVRSAPFEATLAVIYLGIFPAALGYVLWAFVLSRLPASVCGGYLYLVAPIASVVGWAVLGEIPSAIAFAGGGISLLGVVLLRWLG